MFSLLSQMILSTYEIERFKLDDQQGERPQKRMLIYFWMICEMRILYVISVGWTASQKTYLDASEHVNRSTSSLHVSINSTVPVPQHPRLATSKPEITKH